jgi:ferredoxin
MFHVWNENIEVISGYINAKKEIKLDTPNVLFGKAYVLIKLIFNPLIFLFKPSTLNQLKKYSDSSDLPYEELLTTMDNSFYINEKCVGCQNCSRICPVKNIKIVDDTIMAASL